MSKLILFSNPTNISIPIIEKEIFNANRELIVGYMSAEGVNQKSLKYFVFWSDLVHKNNSQIVQIDNSSNTQIEKDKFNSIDVLIVSGGNTFVLLDNVKRNGFDKLILSFLKKESNVYMGFSAGALILTPTIKVAGFDWAMGHDDNSRGLKDLAGLGVLNFEILPHYDKEIDSQNLQRYLSSTSYEVKTLSEDEVFVKTITS